MAKKKNYKRKFKSNEKQLSARLKGFDFSDYDAYGVTGVDVFRYGMINIKKDHASPREVKALSKIILVENRMLERDLDQQADELLLEKLYKEYESIKGFTKEKENKLIKQLENEFDLFNNDETIKEEFKFDLTKFYELRFDAISNKATYVGITYEYAVEIFDAYMQQLANQDVLENTRTSEHE